MQTNQQLVELERNLYEGLERKQKTVSEISMKKVVDILAQFDDSTDDTYWPMGFSYLYLKSANLEADLTDLLALRKIDGEIGWCMTPEKFEEKIFLFKAVKIISYENVRIK